MGTPLSPGAGGADRALWRVVLIVGGVLAIYFLIRVAHQASLSEPNDWRVYYKAGAAFRDRRPLYTLEDGPLLTFKNAPCVALAAVPLSYLPQVPARILWYLIDLVGAALIVCISWRVLDAAHIPATGRKWVTVVAFALTLQYFMNQWQCGQTSTIWVGLTMFAFLLMIRGRTQAAGPVLAAGACLKLVPLCFVPYALLESCRPGRLAGFVVGLAGLLLLPAVWLGWEGNCELLLQWPQHMADTDLPFQVWRLQNQSVLAQLARYLSPTPYGIEFADWDLKWVRLLWLALGCLTAAGLYFWFWRRARQWPTAPGRQATDLALLLLYMTVFNPLAWRYNFIAQFFPHLWVLDSLRRYPHRRWMRGAVLAASLLLNAVPVPGTGHVFELLHAHGARLWGTLLLGVAVVLADRAARAVSSVNSDSPPAPAGPPPRRFPVPV